MRSLLKADAASRGQTLSSAQIEDLRRLAGEAITVYTHIGNLLEYLQCGDGPDFRDAYRAKTLSAQELSSLTRLAAEAIRQLEGLGALAAQPSGEATLRDQGQRPGTRAA